MSDYTIPENTDITKFYLKRVLEQKAPALGKLHTAFMDINIDRVLQSFFDTLMVDAVRNDTSDVLKGKLEMFLAIKKLLCNLNNISRAVDDGNVDLEELVASDAISSSDLTLASKLLGK